MLFSSKKKCFLLVSLCILLLTALSCAQPQFDTKQITSVSITAIKVSSLQNHPPYPTVQKFVKNAQDARMIFGAITTLAPVDPHQVYHCPADHPVYYAYKLDFMHNGKTVVSATSKVTACAFWHVTYTEEKSTSEYVSSPDGFWLQLYTIAKVPMPNS